MTLKEQYQKEIAPKLQENLGLKNKHLIPQIEKVSINVGFGRQAKEKEFVANVEKTLSKISGQKSVFTKAKKSISSFKIREGMVIGAKVTLRGKRMYDFVEKLIKITFPRVRDFRGISEKTVDNQGNLTVGIKEVSSFVEIKEEDNMLTHGLEISISTNAKNREQGLELFKLLGFPFKK
jgi:large subunit ribosomal protein L5